jgi:hypothetical protein
MKKAISLLSVIFVISIFVVGCGDGSSPADSIKEFYKKVEKNDKSAIDHMSAIVVESMGEEKIEQALEEQSKEIAEKEGIAKMEVLNEEIKDETAKVELKITYGNGEEEVENIDMVKEDGDWKMSISK